MTVRPWCRSPRGRFSEQKSSAKRRGIEFKLTFEEWWSLWEPHWDKRGKYQKDSLVMSRKGDVGPYAIGNVEIKTISSNSWECAMRLEKRFTQEDVWAIRGTNPSIPNGALAKFWGCNAHDIKRMKNRTHYAWVPDEPNQPPHTSHYQGQYQLVRGQK